MNNIKPVLLLIGILLNISLIAQTKLKSEGQIPKEFITSSTEKYNSNKKTIEGKKKRTKRNFYLESIFGVDALLKSGKVLYNDPISKYANDIADILLKDDSSLRKKIRIYTVKTPSVNAFATNQGVILLNAGLITRLKTEAELAFVIAHEIAHVKQKHAIEFFIKSKEIDKTSNRKLATLTNISDRSLAKNKFSQNQELEADKIGYELFFNTDYNKVAILNAFDILQKAHVPYQNKPFDISLFEDDFLKFSDTLIYRGNTEIELLSVDSEKSSHPSIIARKDQARSLIKDSNKKNENFLLGEHRFNEVRNLARQEQAGYQLQSGELYHAFYNAYLSTSEAPDNKYAKKQLIQSLYYLAKLKDGKKFREDIADSTFIFTGHIKEAVHFINTLSHHELNVLSINYAWQNRKVFEADSAIQNMFDDLLHEHVRYHAKKEEDGFAKDVFNNLLDNDEFQKRYEKQKQIEEDDDDEEEPSNKKKKKRRSKKNKSQFLGKDKVIFIEPTTIVLKRSLKSINQVETEKSEKKYLEIIKTAANSAELKYTLFHHADLTSKETEKFNKLAQIKDWMNEVMKYDNFENFIPYNQTIVDEITKELDADIIILPIVVTGKINQGTFSLFKFLWFTPQFFYELFVPHGETLLLTMVFDINKKEVIHTTTKQLKSTNHDDMIKQHMYDLFIQIKRSK